MTLPVHGELLNLAIYFLLYFRWHFAKPPKPTNCNTGILFLKLPCPTLPSAAWKPDVLGVISQPIE